MKIILLIMLFPIMAATCKKAGSNGQQTPLPLPVDPPSQGVKLVADGPGNTYELINSVLGGDALEDPDCAHAAFGRHVAEVFDNTLNKNVFAFYMHVTPDNDRCNGSTDRQRNEIKTYGPSPANLKGQLNDTVTYRWKFKIDAGFQPSPSFTHIHQIKAGDGTNDGSPVITLTPRAGTPEKLELIHTGNTTAGTLGKVKTVDLAAFKGIWVEVIEKVIYKTEGSYEIAIRRINDGAELLYYKNTSIDLWREAATFCRPKWGIYRSLNNVSYLRDEEVRFADFCIAEGKAVCQ
ncbi:MAG TPA: heparin lyase I family protein [Chitinophagaceae bacterium]